MFRRLSILLAACALLLVSTAYVSHLHKQDLKAGSGGAQDHCELCLQVDRVAGPAPAPAVAEPYAHYRVSVVRADAPGHVPLSLQRAQQPRAPPRSQTA